MKYLGPKKIEIEDIYTNYGKIVESVTFNPSRNPSSNEKIIPQIFIQMLMTMGTEGTHFLSNVLRNNDFNSLFTEEELFSFYCNCDGFGKKTPEELRKINGGYDWSHIRDSSLEATLSTENMIKKRMVEIYNNYEV